MFKLNQVEKSKVKNLDFVARNPESSDSPYLCHIYAWKYDLFIYFNEKKTIVQENNSFHQQAPKCSVGEVGATDLHVNPLRRSSEVRNCLNNVRSSLF